MEIDEHFIHVNRKHILKLIGNLLNSRHHLNLAVEQAKLTGTQSKLCEIIESNIDALCQGMNETIQICSQAADDFKQQMKDPDAQTAPKVGSWGRYNSLTPLQRALERSGHLKIQTMPTHVPTKSQERAPHVMPFTLMKRKQKNRKRNKQTNIPL